MRLSAIPLISYFASRRPGEKRFLTLVPLTGLATGFAAVALVRLLAFVQKTFWGSGRELLAHAESLSPWHRFLAPTLGGALLGVLILVARRPMRGHGTAGIIESVTRKGGHLPIGETLIKAGATMITVGSGGSLGREGPLVRVGAALGSLLGERFALGGHRLKILVACGSAAGIAAAYNAPVGGALFAMEVILGNFALESFGPIVVASVIGTLVSRSFLGGYRAYDPPPHVTLVTPWELGHYLLMGLVIGIASALFILALRSSEKGFDRLPLPLWLKPLLGFALIGLLGVRLPQIFGNGYDTVNLVLREAIPLHLILLLPLAKMLATAVTMGSGGAGGLFTPTLFVGSVLGSAYGSWCQYAFPGATSSPGAYALVGMGAMVAGTTQAPLTAILMIFELTGDYEILLPLMFACTVAMVCSRLLHPQSIYTEPLLDRGVRLGGRIEELVMDRVEVRDVMRAGAQPVRGDQPLQAVVRRMMDEGRKELFVVDAGGSFIGTITLAELSEHLGHEESLQKVTAAEIAYDDVPVLTLDDPLSTAIGRWSQVSRDRLPVVDGARTRRYVGELSAGDIISLYSQEILLKEARLARFVHASTGGQRPETTYVELPSEYVVALVSLPEEFPPLTLRQLDARGRFGINVIEIKRPVRGGPERRIIPEADTEVRGGDGLIVVGRPADIAHLRDPVRLGDLACPSDRGGQEGGPAARGSGGETPS